MNKHWHKVCHTPASEQNWCWLPGWSFTGHVFSDFWPQLPGHHWIADYRSDELTHTDMATVLAEQAPTDSIWVGWSLGGVLATLACQQSYYKALVTLASGQTFLTANSQSDAEPDSNQGMTEAQFRAFSQALDIAPDKTLRRFLSLCTQGSDDPRALMRVLSSNQYQSDSSLPHTLKWLADYQKLQAPNLPGGHYYFANDALKPQGLKPALNSPAASHSGFLTPKGKGELIAFLHSLANNSGDNRSSNASAG